MNLKREILLLRLLLILSIITSIYLVYLHFSEEQSFCDLSPTISCDVVNKSEWSELFGIPVAIFGLITFILLFIITVLITKNFNKAIFGIKFNKKNLLLLMSLILTWSLIFALYLLIYIEHYKLKGTYCLLCIFLDIIIFIMLLISLKMYKSFKK